MSVQGTVTVARDGGKHPARRQCRDALCDGTRRTEVAISRQRDDRDSERWERCGEVEGLSTERRELPRGIVERGAGVEERPRVRIGEVEFPERDLSDPVELHVVRERFAGVRLAELLEGRQSGPGSAHRDLIQQRVERSRTGELIDDADRAGQLLRREDSVQRKITHLAGQPAVLFVAVGPVVEQPVRPCADLRPAGLQHRRVQDDRRHPVGQSDGECERDVRTVGRAHDRHAVDPLGVEHSTDVVDDERDAHRLQRQCRTVRRAAGEPDSAMLEHDDIQPLLDGLLPQRPVRHGGGQPRPTRDDEHGRPGFHGVQRDVVAQSGRRADVGEGERRRVALVRDRPFDPVQSGGGLSRLAQSLAHMRSSYAPDTQAAYRSADSAMARDPPCMSRCPKLP